AASDGTLFYSDFARGMLGHFFPSDGRVEEWASPGGSNSRPYGIAITGDGAVWYSESGVDPNTLVRFDPPTRRFPKAPIPPARGVAWCGTWFRRRKGEFTLPAAASIASPSPFRGSSALKNSLGGNQGFCFTGRQMS